MDDVQLFVERVVDLDSRLKNSCLHGSCYRFYLLLKQVYRDAEPYINKERDHVVTRIGNGLYDVTGRIGSIAGKTAEQYHRMSDSEIKVAERWHV